MPELLVEIFSEEIPARMQLRAAADLHIISEKILEEYGYFEFNCETYVTPRRLVLYVKNLWAKQADRVIDSRGPKIDAPANAINGFLKSHGLVDVKQCQQKLVGNDIYLYFSKTIKGEETKNILIDIFEKIKNALVWPKSMRWGSSSQVWVRPISKVNIIFDGLPISEDCLFQGHRFLGKSFSVKNFKDYETLLYQNKVILNQLDRKQEIERQAKAIAKQQNLILPVDLALLDEVTGLVEWPVAMLGTFEKEYLDVPQECLIATMRANQKYFPLFDAAGKLANHFVLIANVPGSMGQGPIVHGNERVLRARLSDAKFFYEQDLKTKLDARIEKLKNIQFHEKLGTLYDKTQRVTLIAEKLAAALNADTKLAARAAKLCKADLVTGMVGEFPELQGIMGRYYALASGEDAAVADAIRDHYQPLGPTADVPEKLISIVVALADKLDTLSEFFRINEKPTGSKDPYALRRAALGIIRIILENKIQLPLAQFVAADVLEFIKDRLQVVLRDEGLTAGQVKACLNVSDDIYVIAQRARALSKLLAEPSGVLLLSNYRRAANILKETKFEGFGINIKLLISPFEKALYKAFEKQKGIFTEAIQKDSLDIALVSLVALEGALSEFFDNVFVNDSDATIKENRLNLLGQIRKTFEQFADFSQLEG